MRNAMKRPGGTAAIGAFEQRLRDQQTLHAAGRLVGGVAHEFNDMLAAVQGFATLLGAELEPDSAAAGYLEEIRAAVAQSWRLNRQLQAFSRKQVLRADRLQLNGVVRQATRLLRPLLGGDIALRLSLDPGLAPVKADREQLVQVVVNVALNARAAMPRGGRLDVSTSTLQLAEPTRHADGFAIPAGSHVLLCVTDDGCGMDEGTRARVFEPFFTTHGEDACAGLGLSTVFGIVKQLGGFVWVESAPGAGTSLYICLPEAAAAAGWHGEQDAVVPVRRSA